MSAQMQLMALLVNFILKYLKKGLINMKTRLVFKTNIARKLLRMGYRIVDLKPYKNENGEFDFTRSIYVFADENDIDKEIMELANSQR